MPTGNNRFTTIADKEGNLQVGYVTGNMGIILRLLLNAILGTVTIYSAVPALGASDSQTLPQAISA